MTTEITLGPYTAQQMAESAGRIARGEGTNNDYFRTGLTGVNVSRNGTYYENINGQRLSANERRAYASGGPQPNVRTPTYRPITRRGGDGRVPTPNRGGSGRAGRGGSGRNGIRRGNSPVGNGRGTGRGRGTGIGRTSIKRNSPVGNGRRYGNTRNGRLRWSRRR